jgi:hypothetical protein
MVVPATKVVPPLGDSSSEVIAAALSHCPVISPCSTLPEA